MMTYQDFLSETASSGKPAAIARAIYEHETGADYKTAVIADAYDRQQNTTITEFVPKLFTSTGAKVDNFVASNNRKPSNFFNLLNTQRNSFLLGNGIGFASAKGTVSKNATVAMQSVDTTKKRLGQRFDSDLLNAGYYALIHGVSFCFWNYDRMHVFKLTEFAPLWDEETGQLRAGVRYWCIDRGNKPVIAVLYEENGLTRYKSKGNSASDFEPVNPSRTEPEPYRTTYSRAPADTDAQVIAEENYSALPIVPLYGSRLKQSTLVGMRENIDSYDIIANGWCNDMRDVSQIYWILENYGGMNDADLARFRDRLITMHVAVADTSAEGAIKPYAQEIPYQSRKELLQTLKDDIYRDFGGLDTQAMSGGNMTATAIKAAYEALNQKADDFEMQVIDCVQGILRLMGIDDTPVFKRSMLVNETEQIQAVMLEQTVLDTQTLLQKLPNITQDEVLGIMQRLYEEGQSRYTFDTKRPKTGDDDDDDDMENDGNEDEA